MSKWMRELQKRYYNDIQAIRDSYKETDREFKQWFKENKIFILEDDYELFDVYSDNNPGCNNSISVGDGLRRTENESKVCECHEESYGDSEEDKRISRHAEDRISIEPVIDQFSMYSSYPAKKKRKKK